MWVSASELIEISYSCPDIVSIRAFPFYGDWLVEIGFIKILC